MHSARSSLLFHALAVASVAAAVMLNLALEPWLGPSIFSPFLLAVVVTSLYGGIQPGLTAAALSLVLRSILLWRNSISAATPSSFALRVLLFSGMELLIVYLIVSRKNVLEARRNIERRFRSMAEAIPQLVWVSGPDGRDIYHNRRWSEVTGLTLEEGLGHGWSETIHPEDRKRTLEAWNKAVTTGTPYEMEYRLRLANGDYRWFLGRGLPSRDDKGRIVEWSGTCTDINEQKKAQAVLSEATRAKDHFLAVLSHELRTPLTPVLMAVTAMLDDPQTCPSCLPTLRMIRENIELEARLIDDLLDVSRISKGKMTYSFETTDVHGLIRRVVEICSPYSAIKGHHLVIELGAAEHHVNADPVRLQQVVWNLLTNAINYTQDEGRIAIRTRSESGHIVVEISDNGVGIK